MPWGQEKRLQSLLAKRVVLTQPDVAWRPRHLMSSWVPQLLRRYLQNAPATSKPLQQGCLYHLQGTALDAGSGKVLTAADFGCMVAYASLVGAAGLHAGGWQGQLQRDVGSCVALVHRIICLTTCMTASKMQTLAIVMLIQHGIQNSCKHHSPSAQLWRSPCRCSRVQVAVRPTQTAQSDLLSE